MDTARTLYVERTEHTDGRGSNRPDAQHVASRAAGGGGHGASSGVCDESDVILLDVSVEQ